MYLSLLIFWFINTVKKKKLKIFANICKFFKIKEYLKRKETKDYLIKIIIVDCMFINFECFKK